MRSPSKRFDAAAAECNHWTIVACACPRLGQDSGSFRRACRNYTSICSRKGLQSAGCRIRVSSADLPTDTPRTLRGDDVRGRKTTLSLLAAFLLRPDSGARLKLVALADVRRAFSRAWAKELNHTKEARFTRTRSYAERISVRIRVPYREIKSSPFGMQPNGSHTIRLQSLQEDAIFRWA